MALWRMMVFGIDGGSRRVWVTSRFRMDLLAKQRGLFHQSEHIEISTVTNTDA
jgi:hypothetical protein